MSLTWMQTTNPHFFHLFHSIYFSHLYHGKIIAHSLYVNDLKMDTGKDKYCVNMLIITVKSAWKPAHTTAYQHFWNQTNRIKCLQKKAEHFEQIKKINNRVMEKSVFQSMT